ncbi:MAG: hypothetical protein CMP76_05850 [Flavobacterium sp.]|uniref:hypothetical protein n=1 Tax=Flavobacterium sp. TaxID=239 RepID=UPI000C45BA7A|nr:hypothetical protein [Flavobacterium sp.]MBF02802.1 hypothetical protein [Flavobacterium sp.]|tara:strand:+ start:368 stop:916 length:549 start_codon:yes stop_codon:yes gene_type:complete
MSLYQITQWCFFGFGVYNLIYLLWKHISYLKNKINLQAIDKAATATLILAGSIYTLTFVTDWIFIFIHSESEESQQLFSRLNGPYGFSLYAQQLTYVFFSLIFLLKFVRKISLLRLIFGCILMLNFERIVIFTTSIHRDYLPSSWTMYQPFFGTFILDWLIKFIIFCSFTTVIYFIQNRTKK